jgi:hypothetical protein
VSRILTLGAVLGLFIAASAQAAPPPPSTIRGGTPCDLAASLLRGAKAPLLSDQPLDEGKLDPDPPMQKRRFPEDLRSAWNSQKPSNFLKACPKAARKIPGLRIATAEDWAKTRTLGPGPTISIVGAPIVDRTGRHVLLRWGYSCPGLCAGRFLKHWEKVGSVWIDRGALEMIFS